jgi:hypothetical protein
VGPRSQVVYAGGEGRVSARRSTAAAIGYWTSTARAGEGRRPGVACRRDRVDAYDGPSGGGPFYKKCGFTEVGRTVYRGVPLVYL